MNIEPVERLVEIRDKVKDIRCKSFVWPFVLEIKDGKIIIKRDYRRRRVWLIIGEDARIRVYEGSKGAKILLEEVLPGGTDDPYVWNFLDELYEEIDRIMERISRRVSSL